MAREEGSVPVVAVGASAGGVNALSALVQVMPADLPAAVLVVLHIAPTGPSLLPSILARAGALPATHAEDGETLEAGHIYVAPPDRHLVMEGSKLLVERSPRQNGVRPSVDILFRSVARSRGRRSIGIVLSGTLDDGTAGLIEIGASGGHTVVQDPEEAVFPGMPTSAVRYADPEFVVPLAEIGPLIGKLLEKMPDGDDPEVVDPVDPIPDEADEAKPSRYTCPDCGGTLFEVGDAELLQFRCRVGHGYSGDSLLIDQQAHLESALYSAIVALEERADLSRRMGRRMERSGKHHIALRYTTQAEETEEQARAVRDAVARLSLQLEEQKP